MLFEFYVPISNANLCFSGGMLVKNCLEKINLKQNTETIIDTVSRKIFKNCTKAAVI